MSITHTKFPRYEPCPNPNPAGDFDFDPTYAGPTGEACAEIEKYPTIIEMCKYINDYAVESSDADYASSIIINPCMGKEPDCCMDTCVAFESASH